MKRVVAFFTALILFLVVIFGVNVYTSKKLEVDKKSFGTWTNTYKYLSNEAISKNLSKDTMLLMGSSEFNHGKKTPYHPKNIFKDTKMSPMLIGTSFNQCLNHAITLAGIEPNMKNRKVTLILSPQWFVKRGVRKEAYAARFSESNYIAMLENPKLSKELKKKMAVRSKFLLEKDPTMHDRVTKYNDAYVGKKASIESKVYLKIRKEFISQRDRLSVMTALKIGNVSKEAKESTDKNVDWGSLYKDAEIDGKKSTSSNSFYILDRYYKKKYKSNLNKLKNSNSNVSYSKSPEYDDFKTFIKVCKELNIEPMIIMIPVNGYWYDYVGFDKKKREEYYSKIRHIAKEKKVKLADLSGEEYTPYFMEDSSHIGWKGWVRTNEELYKFYNENEN